MDESQTYSQAIDTTINELYDIFGISETNNSTESCSSPSPLRGAIESPPPSTQLPTEGNWSFESNIDVGVDPQRTLNSPIFISSRPSTPLSDALSQISNGEVLNDSQLPELRTTDSELEMTREHTLRRSGRKRRAVQLDMELPPPPPKRVAIKKKAKPTTNRPTALSARRVVSKDRPLRELSVNKQSRPTIKLSKPVQVFEPITPPPSAPQPRNKGKAPRARSPARTPPPTATQGHEADVESAGEGPSKPPKQARRTTSKATFAKPNKTSLSKPQQQINEVDNRTPESLPIKFTDVAFVVELKVLLDDKVVATFPTVDNTRSSTIAQHASKGLSRVKDSARPLEVRIDRRFANLSATNPKARGKPATTTDIEVYDNVNWTDLLDLIRLHAHHGRSDIKIDVFEHWRRCEPPSSPIAVATETQPELQLEAQLPSVVQPVTIAPLSSVAPAPELAPEPAEAQHEVHPSLDEPPPPYTERRATTNRAPRAPPAPTTEPRPRRTATVVLREGYIPMDAFFSLVLQRYRCEKPHCEQKAKGYGACYSLPDNTHLLLDGRLVARWWNLCQSRNQEPAVESMPDDIVRELFNLNNASSSRRRSSNNEASPSQHHYYYPPQPPPSAYYNPPLQLQAQMAEQRRPPTPTPPPTRGEDRSSPIDVVEAHAVGSLRRYGLWLSDRYPGQSFDIIAACSELDEQGYQLDQLRRMDDAEMTEIVQKRGIRRRLREQVNSYLRTTI
ncbi:hypothetical protein K461DRAFT_279238 [Myriangium duriaei CBS 260.36]|uniref:Uncharacterized protein n=1 Tax=Myriangium duriaei CBS 260.36 TaxID=1168546 RepID=A0A9P4J3I7_9PEZI|nr:hypothetical protein K461DRAFT_279238 [Myriangium duriaei CBS 260.36]